MNPADFTFRPLARADFPLLVAWIARPHVAAWWDSPIGSGDLEELTRRKDRGAVLKAMHRRTAVAGFDRKEDEEAPPRR